ncbi:DUF7683 domain-containing protein [Pseudomonas sp. 3A(2025)]
MYGYRSNEDFHAFKAELPISLEALTAIMAWDEVECFCFVYDVSPEQLTRIAELCPIKFPSGLNYQLSSYL